MLYVHWGLHLKLLHGAKHSAGEFVRCAGSSHIACPIFTIKVSGIIDHHLG